MTPIGIAALYCRRSACACPPRPIGGMRGREARALLGPRSHSFRQTVADQYHAPHICVHDKSELSINRVVRLRGSHNGPETRSDELPHCELNI